MLQIGSLVDGKYKILSEIGRGGMSIVYMAINEKANKTWAIKEVRKEGVNDFKAVKQGLIVETEMLKRLKHKFLPSIVDVIDMEDTFIIVMDYIEGKSLRNRLEQYGAQPQENVIRWAKELCDVLGYLHSQNPPIIYRDMKPANVMLRPDGHIALIDFGTAKEFKEFNVKDTISFGTIGYAAPEQFGGKTDARTDIYCLGATMYHLVTGMDPSAPPYEIRPIKQINPALSSGLEKIILKCTQKEPANRYQSCAELLYALEHYTEIDDIYRKKQKRKMVVFGLSAVLTIASAITTVAASQGAKKVLSENYDYLIQQADDATLTQDQKQELYIEAIQTDATRTEAYLNLVEMYLDSDKDEETGSFTREESSQITQLKAGIDSKSNKGYSSIQKPLQELQTRNPDGYARVCYEIGMAYWYDYQVESDRYKNAVEWFQNATGYSDTAAIFVEIGQCRQNISKYEGQSRTTDVTKEYTNMWPSLVSLVEKINDSKDEDTKRLVWKEIVNTITNQAAYFIEVDKDEMQNLLQKISDSAEAELTDAYDSVKGELQDLICTEADYQDESFENSMKKAMKRVEAIRSSDEKKAEAGGKENDV